MKLKPGARLRSPACTTEVVVVRAPQEEHDLTCCGAPMVDRDEGGDAPGPADSPGAGDPVLIGKRYVEPTSGIEVLCTQAGPGPLAYNGQPLSANTPKPLPASD